MSTAGDRLGAFIDAVTAELGKHGVAYAGIEPRFGGLMVLASLTAGSKTYNYAQAVFAREIDAVRDIDGFARAMAKHTDTSAGCAPVGKGYSRIGPPRT